MVQQMIISMFSIFGFSGKSSSPRYFDHGASYHMTNNSHFLYNITKYSGNLKIHTADGNQSPITTTDDISSTITNVFISPDLTSNLISVGQLVDNDYQVHFSKFGCLMHDHQSGTIIKKGPKVGRLFPLNLSLFSSLPLPSIFLQFYNH